MQINHIQFPPPVSTRKNTEQGKKSSTINKLRKYVRIFGTPAPKPGFPLQSFLPQTAKKDFRCNPLRPTGFPGFGTNS
jgi:hypothetical protein